MQDPTKCRNWKKNNRLIINMFNMTYYEAARPAKFSYATKNWLIKRLQAIANFQVMAFAPASHRRTR